MFYGIAQVIPLIITESDESVSHGNLGCSKHEQSMDIAAVYVEELYRLMRLTVLRAGEGKCKWTRKCAGPGLSGGALESRTGSDTAGNFCSLQPCLPEETSRGRSC